MISETWSQISYSMEQGIISAEQGILVREQGILPGKIEISPDEVFGTHRVAMRLKSFNLLNALSMRQRSL